MAREEFAGKIIVEGFRDIGKEVSNTLRNPKKSLDEAVSSTRKWWKISKREREYQRFEEEEFARKSGFNLSEDDYWGVMDTLRQIPPLVWWGVCMIYKASNTNEPKKWTEQLRKIASYVI